MKRVNVLITILGEPYNLSGDPVLIRRTAELFQETLEQIGKKNRGKDISTHRLGAMAGMALAEKLVIFQDRREKKTGLVNSVQNQVKGLIEILEKSAKKKPDV
ncbi:MAG: cell division protein ZapA [Candidatus Omnitrophota bacterium]